MPAKLLLSVKDAMVRYSVDPVFENLSFNVHENRRVALVGKNGAGKSTLMNIITGKQPLDEGERWEEPGISIGHLQQDIEPKDGQTVFDFIFTEMEDDERELHQYKVDIVAEALGLDVRAQMRTLSGGQIRRAGLARALVEEPDILLLDEPTNHLDLEAIEWLETYLNNYRGTLLCISHDRAFLSNITTNVFWLDRGTLKVSPKGFKYFDEWSQELLDQEARELKNRKAALAEEIEWASRGVKARVKRNVARLAKVREMRDQLKRDESSYKRATKTIKIEAPKDGDDVGTNLVAEFYNVHKSFEGPSGEIPILDKFSMRIRRGDRIGILGKNGSGKTTFLKLLLKELEPDKGRVKLRKELEFSYFDQKRRDLDPDASLRSILSPNGGDYIDVMGKQRHVCGYLKDFMFDPGRAQDKVRTLSGGQKNRLMLARILANPKTCLILDEPTNDLDMETLDMLEEILSQYKGTLIVVSHDRDFLDQTVTKVLAFEGQGKIEEVIGGYSDYLEVKAREAEEPEDSQKTKQKKRADIKPESEPEAVPQPSSKPKKLSYKYEHELKTLPDKIKLTEEAITALTAQLSDPTFYKSDPDGFHKATQDLQEAEAKLDRYETRWLELEEMKAG